MRRILLLLLSGFPLVVSGANTSASNQETLSANHLWVLFAAALVFFMQAGFKALESGLLSSKHKDGVGIKNLIDCLVGGLAFFMIGYGLMFGKSWSGWIGLSGFMGESFQYNTQELIKGLIFFVFQWGFAATALTIVSGAMSGRTGLISYLSGSFILGCLIYPIFGHWAWGQIVIPENEAWLADLGFIDFAGSTVVHSLGAWVSLVGVWMVGPRIGRYHPITGILMPLKANYSYSILGVMILWLGWWGFNGGSTLAFNNQVGLVILNTNLAAAAGGLSAFFHCYLLQGKEGLLDKIIGGTLTGLVAITAGCHVVSPSSSIFIGVLAGLIHNYSYNWIIKDLRLDDAVGAIPVHGFGGAFGTLSVALFGKEELLKLPRWEQLGVQVLGVLVCFIFTTTCAYIMFKFLKMTVGIRVSPSDEMKGSVWGSTRPVAQETVLEEIPSNDASAEDDKVHYISVRVSASGFNVYSPEEFLQIPQSERNIWEKQKKVQYWNEAGNPVQRFDAFAQMQEIITQERDHIQHEKVQITESIQYARRIQKALEPRPDYMSSVLPEHFVLNRPRDIVSGDFYWVSRRYDKTMLAIVDCTGHGVPGAFLSMMGMALLNEVTRQELSPAETLNKLRRRVKMSLHQDNNISTKSNKSTKDGMDVSFFTVSDTRKLEFAGAYHPLYIVREKVINNKIKHELIEFKGDRMPVGIYRKEKESFTNYEFQLEKGDMLYAFSDGFIDQFGGEQGRKFMTKRFKDLLLKIAPENAPTQKLRLEQALEDWKGSRKQVDDILVFGMRIE